MLDGLGGRNLWSLDHTLHIKIWLSNELSITQREGFRWEPNKRADEEISHLVQAHSTTFYPQTNGLVERQNWTLVNMLRVYCSRHMTAWEKYLPLVVEAYNSTKHSTAGISPFMMLTGRERARPLTFFYPEYEGQNTSPQAYVKEAIKRQKVLNELCRRNTSQTQMRQRKKYDEKILLTKPYAVGQLNWVFQKVIPPKGSKNLM